MLNPNSPEAEMRAMGVSPALSAAYDVLDAAGMANHDRLTLCLAAERAGRDPEAFARHLVRLSRSARSETVKARAEQVAPAALPTRSPFVVSDSGEAEAPPTQ